jgi:hypothetical protein
MGFLALAVALACAACGRGNPPRRAFIDFREVKATLPFAGSPSAHRSGPTCENGRRLGHVAEFPTTRSVTLADVAQTVCYVLGPTIAHLPVAKASAVLDPSGISAWVVDVRFANSDFVNKVAGPYANKRVAMIVQGRVVATPTMAPGITTRTVQVADQFDKNAAQSLVAVLSPK